MYKIKFFPSVLAAFFCLICWTWLLAGSSQAFCSSVSGLSCMHLQGTGALLAQNQSGLSLLGLQDPGKPSIQSCFKTPGSVKDMAYSQGYAYLADSEQGLLVIDVRDPLACKQVGSYGKLQDQVKQISAWGNLLLVDLARSGLSVMDISDPARPRMIVALEEPILVKDLLLAQGYAYIAALNGSLHVYDLQDPGQPVKTALLALQESPLQLGISQDRLYLTTRQGRMHILDLSSPDSPREMASVKIGKCSVAALAGEIIYLVDQENSFRLLDISDPSRPRRQAGFKLPRQVLSICIQDDKAYLYLAQNQLWMLDLQTMASGEQEIQVLNLNNLASK